MLFEALDVVPTDPGARLIGRVHDPFLGPCVALVDGDSVVDLTDLEPTVSGLLDRDDLLDIDPPAGARRWPLDELCDNTLGRQWSRPHLMAPCDLQVVKAAGVTFVRSMLERVIEERSAGDPERAAHMRALVTTAVGGALDTLTPGSPEAESVKAALIGEGSWSQYLEVGIGPDPEIFTKAPVLSAVGTGADVGVLERSTWNNPEPELVVAVNSSGTAMGAALGNDVNLRDFEGRSALLLGKAKDNNGSCAIGPFIRLFDERYTLADAARTVITTHVEGEDGFLLEFRGDTSQISRDITTLIEATIGDHHQYPDGFMLFTGTPFAPTDDRDKAGAGFTHHFGDIVAISAPELGVLVNRVVASETAPRWTVGVRGLIDQLTARGALRPAAAAGTTR